MPGLCCLDARIWIWRLVQTINIRWNHLHRPIVIFLKVDASTILWIEPRRHAHKLPLFFVQNTHGATGKLPSGRWTLKSGFSTCTSRTAAANVQSSQVISVSSSPRSDRTLCLDGAGPEVVRVASGNTISRFPDANRHPGRAVILTWASFATPTRETWNPASPVPVTRTPGASTMTNPFVTTAPDSLPQHRRSAAQNAKAPCVRRPPSTLVFSYVHIPNPPR